MKKISVHLNKVVTKGEEMNKLVQELQEFREKVATSENTPNVEQEGKVFFICPFRLSVACACDIFNFFLR